MHKKNAGPSPLKEKPAGRVLDTKPKGSESLSEDMIKGTLSKFVFFYGKCDSCIYEC